jgi:hypothetical protein
MAYTMAGNNYTKRAKGPVAATIPAGFEQVYKDMIAYTGTFDLILNIRNAINRYGKLTDKQWEAVKKCIAPKVVQDPSVILVAKCNIPITVSPNAARYIAKVHNWPLNPCTLMVTQIKSQDHRTITMMVKMDWSSNVSVCRCCGRSLTDWRSQATGIGPTCVKGTNIQYVRDKNDIARFQKDMEDLCVTMGEVEVVLKKWHFKEGKELVDKAINICVPVKLASVPSTPAGLVKVLDTMTIPYHYCTWNKESRKLLVKRELVAAEFVDDKPPMRINVYNNSTGVTGAFDWCGDSASNVAYLHAYISVQFENPITLIILK